MTQPLIRRPHYLKLLHEWRENGLIKVIMGPRRCGKSFLLKLFREELLHSGITDAQILSFELDRLEEEVYHDPHRLHEAVLSRLQPGKNCFLFIDEVQECRGFEKVLASLGARDGIDIYVTGSNAYMLSGELATYLTGRYMPLEMLPLSFSEFRDAVSEDHRSAREDFLRYMKIGGFPALIPYRENEAYVNLYLKNLLSDMLLKDVLPRYRLRSVGLMNRLIRTMTSSVGSSLSLKNIVNTLSAAQQKLSPLTIASYVESLEDCYLFLKAERFDVRGREALRSLEKYYLSDPGFRQAEIHSPEPDLGHQLENIVYLELRRRYPKVSIGKAGDTEVDFVTEKDGEFAYFQVALTVLEPATLQRELRPFTLIPDNYPRYLITADDLGSGRNLNGVRQLNVCDWLLDLPESYKRTTSS